MKKYSIFALELIFPYSFTLTASVMLCDAEEMINDYLANNGESSGTVNGFDACIVSEETVNASNDAAAIFLVYSARGCGDLETTERVEKTPAGVRRIVRFYALASCDDVAIKILWCSPRMVVSTLDNAPEYDNLRISITAKYRRQAFTISRHYSDDVPGFARDFISTVARMARANSSDLTFDLNYMIDSECIATYSAGNDVQLLEIISMVESGSLCRIITGI